MEHNSPSKVHISGSTYSLSSSASSVTAGFARNSALGMPWNTAPVGPCDMIQKVNCEDKSLDVESGGRRDKGSVFLEANKDLMKKAS